MGTGKIRNDLNFYDFSLKPVGLCLPIDMFTVLELPPILFLCFRKENQVSIYSSQ